MHYTDAETQISERRRGCVSVWTRIYRASCSEGFLNRVACYVVAHFRSHECCPLSRFHMEKLYQVEPKTRIKLTRGMTAKFDDDSNITREKNTLYSGA